jgi:hypothetical protein
MEATQQANPAATNLFQYGSVDGYGIAARTNRTNEKTRRTK